MVPERSLQQKHPWANKFRRPSADELLAQYGSKQLAQLVAAARAELAGLAGVTETLSWNGVPWRWSFEYRPEHPSPLAGGQPLAYLVPDPQRPQIAVPLTVEMIDQLPVRRLKRFVREGIVHGRIVAQVYWPSWEFALRSQLDEIMDLVVRKHKLLSLGREPVAERA
jgi:hypothetical protein